MDTGNRLTAAERVVGRLDEIGQEIIETTRLRRLSAGIVAVWAAANLAAGIQTADAESESLCGETDVVCHLLEAELEVPAVEVHLALPSIESAAETTPQEQPTTTSATTTTVATTTTLPPTTTTTVPPPFPFVDSLRIHRADIDPVVEAALRSVELTPAGYHDFLANINTDYFDIAQQYPEFNPNRVAIPQAPTEFVEWHYTVSLYPSDGLTEALGETDVLRFIHSLATKGDDNNPPNHVCCGVNGFIDRAGTFYQLAPVGAKLNHDPPNNSRNVGIEVESDTAANITKQQYETLSYASIAMAHNQGLLGAKPLHEIMKGHGELRAPYLAANPGSRLGVRTDFSAPVASLLREKINHFLAAYPEAIGGVPQMR